MNLKNNSKTKTLYSWLKRVSAFLAISIWFVLIFHIFQDGGGMKEEAPKCIFTTMIVFTILTSIYKGIEILESKENTKQ